MEYDNDLDFGEPTPGELAAIEAEWPQIEAGLRALDAELRALSADGRLCELDRRRVRRAEHRTLDVRLVPVVVVTDEMARYLASGQEAAA
jgi:hypothetical protein